VHPQECEGEGLLGLLGLLALWSRQGRGMVTNEKYKKEEEIRVVDAQPATSYLQATIILLWWYDTIHIIVRITKKLQSRSAVTECLPFHIIF
jgi:hypothetical protein